MNKEEIKRHMKELGKDLKYKIFPNYNTSCYDIIFLDNNVTRETIHYPFDWVDNEDDVLYMKNQVENFKMEKERLQKRVEEIDTLLSTNMTERTRMSVLERIIK